MRRIIIGVLLGATAATPLLAQDARAWGGDPDRTEARRERAAARQAEGGQQGDRREARQARDEQQDDRQEVRRDRGERRDDRQEVRQDRAEVQRDLATGRYGEARRDRAELGRDRAEAGRDRAELERDRTERARDRLAVANGTSGSAAERQRDWRQDRRDDARDFRDDRRDVRDDRRDRRDDRDWGGRPGGWDRGDWTRDWRQDRRYDWQSYRQSNRSLYRAPRYDAPRGYAGSYRRWAPGYRLQPFFYGSSYWIGDPWRYRLPPAYGPYRWVRYYDDVLLIDLRSGLIADAIYGFFW